MSDVGAAEAKEDGAPALKKKKGEEEEVLTPFIVSITGAARCCVFRRACRQVRIDRRTVRIPSCECS